MLLHVPAVLKADEAQRLRARLEEAPWADGRATAGHQSAQAKRNEQLPEDCDAARELGAAVLAALQANALFFAAALPRRVYPPLFNRYREGMDFGSHVDNAIRYHPPSGERFRTDISATLFLAPPADYDGGELAVEDTYGVQRIKLPAGDMVLYPATSRHRVLPVTRGARVAAFFWIESMVRDDARRALLFDLDVSIQQLTRETPGHASLVGLTACYHNLLRMWGEA